MSKYTDMSNELLKLIGGKDNVASVTHCATRLRIRLHDEDNVPVEEIKKLPGVLGLQKNVGEIQVIIGPAVDDAYQEFMRKAEKVFRFTMSVPLAVRMSPGTIPILTRTASRENSPNCGNCSRRAQSMPSTQGSIIPTIRQSTSIIIIKKIFVCLPRWDSRFSGCQSTGLVSIPQEWKKNPIGRGWSFTGTSSGN